MIQKELKKQFDKLSETYDVFGVFLYGSQNYHCDTETSDIDTKAIVVPSLDDLIFKRPVSKRVQMDAGECEVKDIREMNNMFKKQNVNFLEILFTDYYYVPPKYEEKFKELSAMNEQIAHFDEKRAAACILGIFNNEYKRLYREDDEDVKKYGYRRKSYCNIYRLLSTMNKYCNEDMSYRDVIDAPKTKILKERVRPINEVRLHALQVMEDIEKIYGEFLPDPQNEAVGKAMDQFVKDVITNKLFDNNETL